MGNEDKREWEVEGHRKGWKTMHLIGAQRGLGEERGDLDLAEGEPFSASFWPQVESQGMT